MPIPRIIHQFFAIGWNAVPPEARDAIRVMRENNPGWEYRFYDGEAAESFIADRWGKRMLEVYRSIDPVYAAARADLFRYLVCHAEGGLYLDIKSAATGPLDSVIGPEDRFILSQWFSDPDEVDGYTSHPDLSDIRGGEYVQWFIACEARHPYLEKVIDVVLQNIASYRPLRDGVGRMGVLRLTGPIAYTLTIHRILDAHPHSFRDHKTDLKLVYSVFGDVRTHRTRLGSHYTAQTRPIIKTNVFMTAVCMAWFGPVFRARQWLRWKRRGIWARCRAARLRLTSKLK